MDSSPFTAEVSYGAVQVPSYAGDVSPGKSVIFSQFHRSIRTVQIEDRFFAGCNDMHVRWNVVGWVDDHRESVKAQHGWHDNPKRLGYH